MNDKKLMYIAIGMIILPLSLAFFGGDRFRYPCQDSDNWDSFNFKGWTNLKSIVIPNGAKTINKEIEIKKDMKSYEVT